MDTFQKEYRGNVVVITVNLVSATLNDTNEFKGFMDELTLLTECDVVVDLANCNHLDSTFIGALVMNYKKLKQKNRNMVLVEPNDQTKVFLTMNSLSKIFHLYPNVEVAVEDLLNRKIIEDNLTNGNHNVVFEGQHDNSAAVEDPSTNEVMNNSSVEKAENENALEEANEKELAEEKDNSIADHIPNEIIETEQNVHLSRSESNAEEQISEHLEESILEERIETNLGNYSDNDESSRNETEKYVPENFNEELVEEQLETERDYREGTLAWDFGK